MQKNLNSVYVWAIMTYMVFAIRILLLDGGKATLAFTLDVIGWGGVVIVLLDFLGWLLSKNDDTPSKPPPLVPTSSGMYAYNTDNFIKKYPAEKESIN